MAPGGSFSGPCRRSGTPFTFEGRADRNQRMHATSWRSLIGCARSRMCAPSISGSGDSPNGGEMTIVPRVRIARPNRAWTTALIGWPGTARVIRSLRRANAVETWVIFANILALEILLVPAVHVHSDRHVRNVSRAAINP